MSTKGIALSAALIALGGWATTSLAGPPPKVTIWHCGSVAPSCTQMAYHAITVSPNSKGHLNHAAREEDCDDGMGNITVMKQCDYDTQDPVSGNTLYWGNLPVEARSEGDWCGEPALNSTCVAPAP